MNLLQKIWPWGTGERRDDGYIKPKASNVSEAVVIRPRSQVVKVFGVNM